MARLPRIVLPGLPHHVTQRGNWCAQSFFEDGNYALFKHLLGEAARKAGREIGAFLTHDTAKARTQGKPARGV